MLPNAPAAPPPIGAPPAQTPPSPQTLTPDQTAAWWKRIQGSLDSTRNVLEEGRTNLQRYQGKYLTIVPSDDTVIVPTDFWNVEQKRAELFYKLPLVYLEPEERGLDDALVVFQAALNKKLGPKGVNVLPRVKQVLFDVLCPTQFGALKVGFQSVPGETTEQPAGVDSEGNPTTQAVPSILAKWYFAEYLAPGDLLVPADHSGLDFDAAPFLGMRFKEDVKEEAGQGASSDIADDERRLTPYAEGAKTSSTGKRRTGFEVWYRASVFDGDVAHPDLIRVFRIYDDDRETIVDLKNSPYQVCDPTGKLQQGMLGYPICPLTMRAITDSWMAPSDCTMARPLADELSRGRSQMVQFKNRTMPQVGYDATRVEREDLEKIQRNETGAWIGFSGPYQDATWPIQKGDFKRESFQFNEIISGDLERLWANGPAPGGSLSDQGTRTASEVQDASKTSDTRLNAERDTVLLWYLSVVSKFASLLQLFADETEFVELLGSDAQRLKSVPPQIQQQAQQNPQALQLVPWNKDLIQGRFSFSARANSQIYVDPAVKLKQLMDTYNFFANSPNVNRAEIEREIMVLHGWDPQRMLQQPPPPRPPEIKSTLNIVAATDLDPMNPQYQNVVAVLQFMGVQGLLPPSVDPATAHSLQVLAKGPAPKEEHGGAAIAAEKLAQHPLEQTGGMQGSGAPAPQAPGGHLG